MELCHFCSPGSYKLNTPKHIRRRHSDSENDDSLNKALEHRQEVESKRQIDQPDAKSVPTSKDSTLPPSKLNFPEKSDTAISSSDSRKSGSNSTNDRSDSDNSKKLATDIQNKDISSKNSKVVSRQTKSILKKDSSRRSTNRISFDPLALLLDASLEGEVDLVKKVSVQVCDHQVFY